MSAFVQTSGDKFTIGGEPFYFGGINSYSLFYLPKEDVDSFFQDAAELKTSVVRTWLFCDGKTYPGGEVIIGSKTYWFQDIDPKTGQMYFNDNEETGLGRFDYVLDSAKRHGVKLIVTLAQNWAEFGGADVYVDRLSNSKGHLEFFKNPKIKAQFKNWVSHALNRVSVYSGLAYKDDPTIMIVELMNEPRCVGSNRDGKFPQGGDCKVEYITNWFKEMSDYTRLVDTKHLIGTGDEGFFNHGYFYPEVYSNVYDGSSGLDFVAISNLPNINVLGIHSYMNQWTSTFKEDLFIENTQNWFIDHMKISKQLQKPFYIGEYGVTDPQLRIRSYPKFQKVVLDQGAGGALSWVMLSNSFGQSCKPANPPTYEFCKNEPGIETFLSSFCSKMLAKSFI
ncbi:glycoside hydrolase superfamily [Globomyces pollinis-pini]|nr:glycoside hydrolase superfamily [Globomyces pollinis-pini]